MQRPPRLPNYYPQPLMLPLRWQDVMSGVLPCAIMALLDYTTGATDRLPTEEQLSIICVYFAYYVNAPGWKDCDGKLTALREKAETLKTVEDIDGFFRDCLEIGIDPL